MATNVVSTLDRYRGCMFGLAIGDALGAVGLVGWNGFPPGSFTDDTQMSLATAIGCVRAGRAASASAATEAVYRQYLAWVRTQHDDFERRAPGTTCLSALDSGEMGTPERRLNDSKGCGGVMRTVYCALKFGDDFRSGVIAAVNHSGDSDSTGSIAGAIMGAALGIDALPPEWITRVEDSDRIDRIARALHAVFDEGKEGSLGEYPAR